MSHESDQTPEVDNDTQHMREQVEMLEQKLALQQRISYAAGLFQGDVTVRTLLESLTEGIIVVDHMGAIILVNQRAVTMFGYLPGELVGQSINILIPDRYIEFHDEHMRDYFKSPHIRAMGQGYDLIGHRKDGTEFPVEISLSTLETEAGRLGLTFVTDISKRKSIEHELLLRNKDLEAFAHTLAHDLKGLLAILVGMSIELADTHHQISGEDLHLYLTQMASSGLKMNNIIDGLLLFASMRKGDVQPKTLDMSRIVRDALDRLQYYIESSQADIIIPDQFETALGQAEWVEEVWLNYLSNAIKYGGNPPRVELSSQQLDDGTVKFMVTDNGRGLSPEEQAALFQQFVRFEQVQTEGYGLGLSIVKEIVTKLGGEVGVTSQVGQGSTFFFTLPADPS